MIPDPQLADEILRRLNDLIRDNPTIQVHQDGSFGFLGLLNGIVGAIPNEGSLQGWGFIAAVFDDAGRLQHFRRTDQ